MKNYRIYLILVFASILIFCSAIVYINRMDISKRDDSELKPKIVLISHVYSNPYWNYVKEGAEIAAKERGAIIEYQGPSAASIKDGIKLIDRAVAAKVAGIITYVQDEEAYTPYINKAVEKGIPIVTVDSDAKGSKRLAYVGTDNIKAGEKAAEELISRIGKTGNVAIIVGGEKVKNQIERVQGFANFIKGNSNIEISTIDYSGVYLLESELAALKILKQNTEIQALFCTSALGGVGVAKAVSNMGLEEKVAIISFDDLPETIQNIRSGVVQATIVQKPYVMGYRTVNLIMDSIEGKNIKGEYLTDMVVVNKNNLNNYNLRQGEN